VPAQAGEQVGELAQVSEVQGPVAVEEERDPADGGSVVADRAVVADQEAHAERVGERDLSQLCGRVEREMRVPRSERTLKLGVGVALGRHGERMFAHALKPRGLGRGRSLQVDASARPT
jgi:hypothetical protein